MNHSEVVTTFYTYFYLQFIFLCYCCVQVFQLGTCRQCVQRISDANTQPGSGYYSTRSVKVSTKFRGNFHLIYCNILLKHLISIVPCECFSLL